MWGIWIPESAFGSAPGYWLCEPNVRPPWKRGVLVFFTKRAAMARAAHAFGMRSYVVANRKGLCEVRPFPVSE